MWLRAHAHHDRCERGLADLKRITPQVVPVQLNQVEGVEEGVTVMASVADTVERGNAIVNHLSVTIEIVSALCP
jgi:hypothetical protein